MSLNMYNNNKNQSIKRFALNRQASTIMIFHLTLEAFLSKLSLVLISGGWNLAN